MKAVKKVDILPYVQCLEREIAKRRTTYPRMVVSKIKKGMPLKEAEDYKWTLIVQENRLKTVLDILETEVDYIDFNTYEECFKELKRELKMRKSFYPRMVYFKRLKKEVADYELEIWKELITYFEKRFIKTED